MAKTRIIKVICAMVSSLNGKITDGTDPHIYKWSSKEDQDYFFSLIDKAKCIVMGKNTYEYAKQIMQHRKDRIRIILTSHPETYRDETIPGQLEFSNEQPIQLLERLQESKFTEVLLVGGAITNASFFKKKCIDEFWLTIEPVIFPEGTPLFVEGLKQRLVLKNIKKLNGKGTLLIRYTLQEF